LDSQSDTHTDGSATLERAEVNIQIAYSIFNYGDAVVVFGKYILKVNCQCVLQGRTGVFYGCSIYVHSL
jgi:hypothetical protein